MYHVLTGGEQVSGILKSFMALCLCLVCLTDHALAGMIRHQETTRRFAAGAGSDIERAFVTFTAYNDFAWADGQLSSNITHYEKDQSGYLVKYATGRVVQVYVTLAGGSITAGNRTTQGAISAVGTEGYGLLNGIVTCVGVWSYGVFNITIAIAGCDPRLNYEIVMFGNRDNITMADRLTTATISDVSSFRNTSTPGASFAGEADAAVVIANGYNTVTGYVARFSGVKSGDDGDMLITISSPTDRQYMNAMILSASRW